MTSLIRKIQHSNVMAVIEGSEADVRLIELLPATTQELMAKLNVSQSRIEKQFRDIKKAGVYKIVSVWDGQWKHELVYE